MSEVGEFMVPANLVLTCAPTATIKEAATLIHDKHVGSLIVCESVKGAVFVCGIITKSDLIRAAYVDCLPATSPCSEIMTKHILTVTADMSRDKVAERMAEKGLHHSVVQGPMGEFLGSVSTMDVVREAALASKAVSFSRDAHPHHHPHVW